MRQIFDGKEEAGRKRRKEAKRDGCGLLGHTATLGALPWARLQLSMAQGTGEQQEVNHGTVLTSMGLGTVGGGSSQFSLFEKKEAGGKR